MSNAKSQLWGPTEFLLSAHYPEIRKTTACHWHCHCHWKSDSTELQWLTAETPKEFHTSSRSSTWCWFRTWCKKVWDTAVILLLILHYHYQQVFVLGPFAVALESSLTHVGNVKRLVTGSTESHRQELGVRCQPISIVLVGPPSLTLTVLVNWHFPGIFSQVIPPHNWFTPLSNSMQRRWRLSQCEADHKPITALGSDVIKNPTYQMSETPLLIRNKV